MEHYHVSPFYLRLRAAALVIALVLGAYAALGAADRPARADTAPPPGTPSTVSADALPTVQQNGVVWAEVTVGNIVYATGSFSQTWPAGSTNTPANDTPRANLLAFDITTGNLVTSFNHSLNAQGLSLAASPDGSRVYVGGDFTTVDGQPRSRIAAFDTATGALDSSFAPTISNEVDAITATNATVYAGGSFFNVNGHARTRLAALAASNGALLSWAPAASGAPGTDDRVTALVVTPDQTEVVIGGRFSTLSGTNTWGLGAVTTASGAVVPYAANSRIQDYSTYNGKNAYGAGIESLVTDGSQVYGSGFSYGAGNFEGTFGLDPDTGTINFVNDCHGDTYSVFPAGQVLYSVSHAHDCSAVGAFPDTNPRIWHHALAQTTYGTGTNTGPDSYGWNYNGVPDSTLLQWYPTLAIGSYTHQYQAAWAVTGNSNYLALAGEFPTVNGGAQQGIVRFAVRSLAPNKTGPTPTSAITPRAEINTEQQVQVNWTATWDEDNANLTYNVLRDGAPTPVYSVTRSSNFWQLPSLSVIDQGLAPGSTHTYRVQVLDPLGNKIGSGTSNSITVPGGNAVAPHASFTASCTANRCSVDAASSTAPNSTIRAYRWSWGDGTRGTGVSSKHVYRAAGSYQITLSITDASGRTATATHTVTARG
ncbi:MAG: PKD domain-containing protein [Jatrophihabitantaceae bacterium]